MHIYSIQANTAKSITEILRHQQTNQLHGQLDHVWNIPHNFMTLRTPSPMTKCYAIYMYSINDLVLLFSSYFNLHRQQSCKVKKCGSFKCKITTLDLHVNFIFKKIACITFRVDEDVYCDQTPLF